MENTGKLLLRHYVPRLTRHSIISNTFQKSTHNVKCISAGQHRYYQRKEQYKHFHVWLTNQCALPARFDGLRRGVEARTLTESFQMRPGLLSPSFSSMASREGVHAGDKPHHWRRKNSSEKPYVGVTVKDKNEVKLKLLLNIGGKAEIKAAWKLFKNMVDTYQANSHHFSWMIKACHNSDTIRVVMDVDMKKAGLKPDTFSYNLLVTQLMIEGHVDAARKVVEEEMPAVGVEPDTFTSMAFDKQSSELDAMRCSSLISLMKRGEEGMKEAKKLLNKLLETEQANTHHIGLVMVNYANSDDCCQILEEVAKQSRVKPDVELYNIYVNQLLLEGDRASAEQVVREEMPSAGVEPNEVTRAHFNASRDSYNQQRAEALSKMIRNGDDGMMQARQLLTKLILAQKADVGHFNVVMKACKSSNAMKYIMDIDMKQAQVKPNRTSYLYLIRQLMFEGDERTAHDVVRFMPFVANRHILKSLEAPDFFYDQKRTKFLSRMVRNGGDGMKEAWDLLNKLIENEKATVHNFNALMNACYSSGDLRHIIDVDMKRAGVKPDIFSYTTLVNQLILEGDEKSALKVVNEEMSSAGIEPDKVVLGILERSPNRLSHMRKTCLSKMIDRGAEGEEGAKMLFKKLIDQRQANTYHFNVMMRTCQNSDEIRQMLDNGMEVAGVKPNAGTYSILVRRLVREGDMESARRIVVDEMPSVGMEPHWSILKIVDYTSETVDCTL